MNARRPVPTEIQPQQSQTSAARALAPEAVVSDVSEAERKARFRASMAWALDEYAVTLEKLAR
jgi:hypothetical protein